MATKPRSASPPPVDSITSECNCNTLSSDIFMWFSDRRGASRPRFHSHARSIRTTGRGKRTG
eukprot:477817-Prorocentrum_minimum.AAC.1